MILTRMGQDLLQCSPWDILGTGPQKYPTRKQEIIPGPKKCKTTTNL